MKTANLAIYQKLKQNISQINEYETEYLFNEIFNNKVYLRNNIKLGKKPVVIDVGANIGLFSLYIKTIRPASTVYSIEPIPDAFECLETNMSRFGSNTHCIQSAVSEKNGKELFHYYPGYSVISGFHSNETLDKEVIVNGTKSFVGQENLSEDVIRDIENRFELQHRFFVETRTLSRIIRDNKIKNIDLLKIDAEKSEIEILKGVNSSDWIKIKQIVVEAHDPDKMSAISYILKRNGFKIVVEEDDGLANSEVYLIYGTK